MTDYRLEPAVRQVSWTAIWGGVLTFLAIWAVFETLATASSSTMLRGTPTQISSDWEFGRSSSASLLCSQRDELRASLRRW